MKMRYILFSLFLFPLVSCDSDEFLTKFPKDQLVENTTFTSNANFETFTWKFYNTFPGYRNEVSYLQETSSDLMVDGKKSEGSPLLFQNKTVPASSWTWNSGYSKIRSINLMLDNIEGSQLMQDEKKHWRSVGYFFRAYEYFFLLKTFGEVPWINRALNDGDVEELYKPRTPRNELADSIVANLQYAEANINPNGNGPNTINTDVVRALISRFGLFEGTWCKYHGLGNEQKYLIASKEASTKLIAEHPDLHSNYDEIFNSESLENVAGILLYKEYEFPVITGLFAHKCRSAATNKDLTKKAADKFLCNDGQTIFTSPLFMGEEDPYTEFRNRDLRFYYNITPPFRVDTDGKNQYTWKLDSDPKHREYIDIMAAISDGQHKQLPTANWKGLIVRTSPHFKTFNEGHGYNVTSSGYKFHKYYNKLSIQSEQDFNDAPIFRMGEVLLNYAEAMCELGEFNQAVADLTINKLRVRGNVAPLNIGNIPEDPTRDADVSTVLWEIRRERSVEYLAEGFGRILDIKRWKKLVEYGSQEKKGRWIKMSDYNNKVKTIDGAAEGYVKLFGPPPGVPGHYYLEPLPSNEIILNTGLVQNPGWESHEGTN